MARKIEKLLKVVLTILIVSVISLLGLLSYDRANKNIQVQDSTTAKATAQLEEVKKTHPRYKIDWTELESKILKTIGNETENYAVVIKDLESESAYTFNEQKKLHPASIYKVPLALIVLSDIDSGEISLDDKLLVTSKEKVYSFDPMSKISGNYEMSIEKILEYLIIYSDNTAMTTLEHKLDGVDELQKRMCDELEICGFTRLPGETNALETAGVFEGIYNQKYLSEESNELLVNLLKNVTDTHNDRIAAGVPADIEVAHKIGTLTSTYHDAGIVYGEKRDYVIVVLNDQIDPTVARAKISQISKDTYEFLNK